MPGLPPVSRSAGLNAAGTVSPLAERAAAIFQPDGPLAQAFPDFEARDGQVQMARLVGAAIDRGGVALAEAGTGTGKTLAYLVPAVLSGRRILISTGTKNLQEQIFFKDVPALNAALGVTVSATCMKGRGNYLCLHRLDQLGEAMPTAAAEMFLPIIRAWAGRTESGDRAELEDLPEELPLWNDVSASADTCLGTECPRYNECFVTRMRQRAAESTLVIVNHHLLCADAAVRQSDFGEVIPACHVAIIDEAHQLEDVATQYFGFSVSNYRFEDLARDLERLARSPWLDGRPRHELTKAIERLRDRAHDFFSELAMSLRSVDRGRAEDRIRISAGMLAAVEEPAVLLTSALDLVESTIRLLPAHARDAAKAGADDETDESGEDTDEERLALARRADEMRTELRFLLRAGDPTYVYFAEFRGRGTFLRASPIDVSGIVRELLLEKMHATVLTSATLTVDGSFSYIRGRLGVTSADEVRLASEFDYARQAILYLPPRMPDPRSPEFLTAAGKQVVEILKRTRGRAFVLFTSYAALRSVQAIAEMALEYPIFVQGTAPRTQLLRQFRETPHSVLFATSSFWQGVDVVGEALSCVIIDKLPFASPGDPITAARIDAIRARSGEPFDEYQVPLAILALQQGLGRLIRHRRDRGVLAVLDPRLRTKGYGRRFIGSLPPAPVVTDLDAVEGFFSIV
ncbi:MAG TPA: ATP-dependent DNA helicase [Vicinamibacterales bacterium]|nr:ATP-dependent DNA helicase [Vicinamibacterales bacterium]